MEEIKQNKTAQIIIFAERRSKTKSLLCHCSQMILDEETELLQCQSCERYFTPFNWLVHLYRDDRNLAFRKKTLLEDVVKLQTEVEALKRQRTNLRRSIKAEEQESESK